MRSEFCVKKWKSIPKITNFIRRNVSKNEESAVDCDCKPKYHKMRSGASGGIYGLAFLGALVYFIQHADTFWIGVYGFFKALVWPAILVYKALEFFKL